MGELIVLPEVVARDGGSLLSLTVFIMILLSELHKSAVSLCRLSMRNYALDLNQVPAFISLCYCKEQ